MSSSRRCHQAGDVIMQEISSSRRCHQVGDVITQEMSSSRRCHQAGDVIMQEMSSPRISLSSRCEKNIGERVVKDLVERIQ
jgi:hypothetical protein